MKLVQHHIDFLSIDYRMS